MNAYRRDRFTVTRSPHRDAGRLLLFVLLIAGWALPARSDETSANREEAEAETESVSSESDLSADRVTPRLPESFSRLRPIYFFQGQAAGLVPDTFRPVAAGQLDERLKSFGSGSLSPFAQPQLTRAVYIAKLIDSSLVSNQTTWEISHQDDSPTRLKLGRLGLAIGASGFSSGTMAGLRSDALPIETDPEGMVSVPVRGDTKLALSWTAAGEERDREIGFDLAIPAAGQSRWLIEVPAGVRLVSLDGVVERLSNPPPEAQDPGRGTSWYRIDSGGLSRLRLRAIKGATGGADATAVIRQASLLYELNPAVIRFTARLVSDPSEDGTLPEFRISEGRVTSVAVGGSATRWTESSATDGRLIRIDAESAEAPSGSPVTITIGGEASWGSDGVAGALPWIVPRQSDSILLGGQLQSKLMIDSRLNLLRLDLPAGWQYLSPAETDDRRLTYRIGGPWGDRAPLVRVVSESGQPFAESIVRLSATESRYRAILNSVVRLPSQGPSPIVLRFDQGWILESVTLPRSGRAIEVPADFVSSREVTLWPASEEIDEGTVAVRATGYRPLRVDGDFARYPATAFGRVANARTRFAASVSPPPGFRWLADASLSGTRIDVDRLTPTQRRLLGDAAAESMLLDISHGRVGSLRSFRPAAAFNVDSRLSLTVADDRLRETHVIRCDSGSSDLDQVRVEFEAGDRPDIEWSVDAGESPTRRLIRARRLSVTPTDIAVGEATVRREIWDLELERTGSRSVVLVGRREYPLKSPVRVELPSVFGANSRSARVLVPRSLQLVGFGEGVLRVPPITADGSAAGVREPVQVGDVTLRYDSSGTSWVEVAMADPPAAVPVVWRETVQCIASSGGDWITATYSLDSGADLVIEHDTDLRLVGVTDSNGADFPHDAGPGRVVVKERSADSAATDELFEAAGGRSWVTIRWARPVAGTAALRNWSPPRISTSAVILDRHWQVMAATDVLIASPTFDDWGTGLSRAFDQILATTSDRVAPPSDSLLASDPRLHSLDPLVPRSFWLVDRSLWLSLGSIVGFLTFAIAWWAAPCHPVLVGIGFAISLGFVPWLADGWVSWVAAVSLPLASGGLIGTTLAASGLRPFRGLAEGGPTGGPPTPLGGKTSVAATARSVAKRGVVGLGLGVVIVGGGTAWGQNPAERVDQGNRSAKSERTDRPMVLVPTTAEGTLVGDKVYISQRFFNELFRDKRLSVAPPLITSAVYRLRLDGMTESGMPAAEWEIRYSLSNLSRRSEIFLPIRPQDVRSVQWLPGGEAKPLRWTSAEQSGIRISLPPTDSAALLLRLATDVESPERQQRRIAMTIPAVATASLVVDSTAAVQRFDLRGAIGQVLSKPEAGRLSADLGAVNSLELLVMLRQGNRGIPGIEARRYWIHAGPKRYQVECEVEPAIESIRGGIEVPIVVLGDQQPRLTSTDWSIRSHEIVSAQRQLLTIRSRRETEEPIRLLWDLATPAVTGDNAGPTLVIPEVISAGSAATSEALIALQASDGFRLSTLGDPESIESADQVDAFVTAWQGYRGIAQDVIRAASRLPRFELTASPVRRWSLQESHHLHVRQGEMLLSYEAVIRRGERSVGPLRLVMPARLDAREITINGSPVAGEPTESDGAWELLLGEPTGAETIRLRVNARQPLSFGQAFNPPRIRVDPITEASGSYSLTRDRSLRVEQLQPPGLAEFQTSPLNVADQLLGGWIPCWDWRLEPSLAESAVLGGSFRVEPLMTRLEVTQRTAIRWHKSRWMVDVLFHIESLGADGQRQPLLDDINVELPTAWDDQVSVEPAEAWSSQPGVDQTSRIIRIRPDAESRSDGEAKLRIQGMRISETDSSLEVPSVRLLGAASVRSFLVVPRSVAGRPLVWNTLSAVADRLPAELADQERSPAAAEDVAGDPSAEEQLVFRSLNAGAAVQLQPSRPDGILPRATATDIRLFPQGNDEWLAIIRWDLEPGDATAVSLQIPPGCDPIAGWNAGQPIAVAKNRVPETLDVTLALSRLAQPLVLLCRFQRESGQPTGLPTLVGIESQRTWLTIYRASGTPDRAWSIGSDADIGWQTSSPKDRWLSLAESVIEVTEASISGATDRPQDELVSWLRPWDGWMNALRREAVKPNGQGTAWQALLDGTDSEIDLTESGEAIGGRPGGPLDIRFDDDTAASWELLGRQWRQYVRRVAGSEVRSDDDPPLSVSASSDWTVGLVATYAGAARELPELHGRSRTEKVATAIELLIAVVMAGGGCWLAWRFRHHLVRPLSHPAVWLFVVGLTSLVVAPTPVAIAICAVAAAVPLLAPRPAAGLRRGVERSFTDRSGVR